MSIIRKVSSEETNIFDKHIIDSCQYEDNIYLLCSTYVPRRREIYVYNKYTGMKKINVVTIPMGMRLYLKKNTSRPPELLYIHHHGGINILIQNIHNNGNTVTAFIPILDIDNEYVCSDNILVIIYEGRHVSIYNIEKKTIDLYNVYNSILCYNIYYDSKLYLVGDKDNIRYVTLIDVMTGDVTIFDGISVWEDIGFYICQIFMIDGILHCDIDEDNRICIDVKSGRQYLLTGTAVTLPNVVINRKGTKMTTFGIHKIYEYDIIIGTLFKSACTHEKYNDISITFTE